MSDTTFELPTEELRAFCERWKIAELSLFGSALTDDFGPESDIDFLVTFTGDAEWGLLDHVEMQIELQSIVRREVDLVTRRAVERSGNSIRRTAILNSAQVLYAFIGEASILVT
ncbi:MAG: nucleotidyltransferase family protein [Ardenticatenaceae bacterium]